MDLCKLKGAMPESFIAEIPFISEKFGVNTPMRLAHFLAQCSHESGGFKVLRENLNYSAEGLQKIFGKYFPTAEIAALYARKPEKIANKVYSGRMGNGDEKSGDGWKFAGKGAIQLTGRDNYTAFDKTVDDDILANPNLVVTKYPLTSAGWFWNKNGLNAIADGGATDEVVTKITKRVNGGTIGLPHRIEEFNKFNKLLS